MNLNAALKAFYPAIVMMAFLLSWSSVGQEMTATAQLPNFHRQGFSLDGIFATAGNPSCKPKDPAQLPLLLNQACLSEQPAVSWFGISQATQSPTPWAN